MKVKQVIVVRKDLKMRRGKEIAQGSHASLAFLKARLVSSTNIKLSDVEMEWLWSGNTKICLQVDSEAELNELFEKARAANLEANLIVDSGRTEFGGVPTATCLAIGPDLVEKIDPITSHLKIY